MKKTKISYGEYKTLKCKLCDEEVYNCGPDAIAVTCSSCVQEMIDPPQIKSQPRSDGIKRPRGWRLYNEFVDSDGNVYHKGVEQPKLKGTLEPTKVKKKKKLTTREKSELESEMLVEIEELRRSMLSAKTKTEQVTHSKKMSRVQKKLKKMRGY